MKPIDSSDAESRKKNEIKVLSPSRVRFIDSYREHGG